MHRKSNKKKITALAICLLLLPQSVSVPSGGSGSGTDDPPEKQSKPSCYFSTFHYGKGESASRKPETAVSIKCGGGELKKIGELLEIMKDIDHHGSFSNIDLLLNRGGAIYMKDRTEEENWMELYICPDHLKELLTAWGNINYNHVHHGIRTARTKILCSWPWEKHDKHIHGHFIHYVMREEARIYLLITGRHIHVGAPLCYEHHREIVDAITEYLEKMDDPTFDECSVSDNEVCTREELIRNKFFEFATLIGISRPEKDFSGYKPDTHRKKVDAVMRVKKVAIRYIAPGHESEVESEVNARCSKGMFSGEASIEPIMNVIADEHLIAPTKRDRDYVLALVCGSYPYHFVCQYIPNLSHSKYYRSQLFALSGNLHPEVLPRTLDRIDHIGVLEWIGYLSSPNCMEGLPYNSRTVTLSTGEVLDIPNTVRLMGHAEMVRGFGNYMRDRGMEDHLLSDSTLYHILRELPADQRYAKKCMDQFKARAFYSFDDIFSIIHRWLEFDIIDKQNYDRIRRDVLEDQLYLRSDFSLHLKDESRIAEHSFFHALSDPNDPDFRHEGQHDHEHQCPRCSHMQRTMRELAEVAKRAVDKTTAIQSYNKEAREMQFRIQSHSGVIWALRDHEIRSKWADRERERMISNLKEGEGFLTIDWAQRWEPMWYLEPQDEYFSKAGASWHFSHIITKIGEEFVTHVWIHLLETKKEDSVAVVAILEHVLTDAKKMGVHTFHIRSDNAGCYHSSATLGSMQWLAQRTRTTISSYSFSEPQHGKSSPDRWAGIAKRHVRRVVGKGKNAKGLRELYNALIADPQIVGVSVHLARVQDPTSMPDETKLESITNYGHFEFTADTIRVWKYRGIGEGKIVPNMQAIEVELRMLSEEGYYANGADADRERFLVMKGMKSNFWNNDVKRKDTLHPEDRDNEAVVDGPVEPPKNPRDKLFHCHCGAGFITWRGLQNHLEWGTCRVIPEKINIIDFSIKAYKNKLEDIANLSPLRPLKDVVDSIIDPTIPVPEEGFALRKNTRGGKPLPANARAFVVEYYEKIRKEGQRPEAENALQLLTTVDSIRPEDRLTYQQIKTLFSRLSKKKPASRARRFVPEDEEELGEWDEDWDNGRMTVDVEEYNLKFVHENEEALFDMSI